MWVWVSQPLRTRRTYTQLILGWLLFSGYRYSHRHKTENLEHDLVQTVVHSYSPLAFAWHKSKKTLFEEISKISRKHEWKLIKLCISWFVKVNLEDIDLLSCIFFGSIMTFYQAPLKDCSQILVTIVRVWWSRLMIDSFGPVVAEYNPIGTDLEP